MPTLPELLSQVRFITQETVVLALFATAAVILLVRDWRVLIISLLAQYILAGLILSRLVRPDIAVVKVMIGVFISLILFLSMRQVSAKLSGSTGPDFTARPRSDTFLRWWHQHRVRLRQLLLGDNPQDGLLSAGFVFRLLSTLMLILVSLILSQMITLSGLSSNIRIAVCWLILAGLVTLLLSEEPLKIGLGLFTVFTGFDLFYSVLERGLLLTGLWGMLHLLIALAIGYLIVANGIRMQEEF